MEYLNNARQKQDFTDFVNKVRNANEGLMVRLQDRHYRYVQACCI